MPGPPSEMSRMWEHEVAPELEQRADGILVSRTLKTTGIGEGTVDEMLAPLLSSTNPSIGIYARRDGVHARISAKAATREEAWHLIHPMEDEARQILGPSIWGVDDETLEAAIGRLLIEKGLTLGVMESATGGTLADTITDVPGASEYFKGSLVAYGTQAKIAMGVPAELVAMHGVVSPRRWPLPHGNASRPTSPSVSRALPATKRSRANHRARCTSRCPTASTSSTHIRSTTRAARPRRDGPRCSHSPSCVASS
jgi:hypothetical protein